MEANLTHNQFYDYLVPEDRKSYFYYKVYRKLFSLITKLCKGNFTYEFKDNYVHIVSTINGHKLYYKYSKLEPSMSWTKMPDNVLPYKIEFNGGYIWTSTYSHEYHWVKSNGEYIRWSCINIYQVVNRWEILEGLFRTRKDALHHSMENNPKSHIKLSEEFKFRNLYVCVKEFFPDIKPGHIFDKNEDFGYTNDLKNVYSNRYSDFQRYTIDLSKEIEKPQEKIVTCYKAKFGCQHGCMYSCLSKDVDKKNKRLYKLFLKWKEIYENNK
jgi:hypothetical protein